MARLFWIAVGATGGIYAYRKTEQVAEVVRANGVAGTAQLVTGAAVRSVTHSESAPGVHVGGLRISRDKPNQVAIMDTGAVDITDGSQHKAVRRKAR